ncbi:DUF2845 domain-containing protein [Geobacter pickeringii]|uniref:Lipoprotein n=1 Tax=Geobacter pickeringii TaxID=345632 RepID=A0A0B5BAX7_9BACT|nr:DUF2845 domain-containing protein [Geobacter pickeringii]AJE03913.1 hypothetical protein GPICK_11630 [Geobacter pickeringii]
MGKMIAIAGACLLALAPWGAGASETGTMICRGGIVSIGDAIPAVLHKCGPPVYATQREQSEVTGSSRHGGTKTITRITIDDWTYNFGPNEFMYQLIFENGRVARIESLDWGY